MDGRDVARPVLSVGALVPVFAKNGTDGRDRPFPAPCLALPSPYRAMHALLGAVVAVFVIGGSEGKPIKDRFVSIIRP